MLKKEQRIPRLNVNKAVAEEYGISISTVNTFIKENKGNTLTESYKLAQLQYFESKKLGTVKTQNDIYKMLVEEKKLRSIFIRTLYFSEKKDPYVDVLFEQYPVLISYYRNNTKDFPDKQSKRFMITYLGLLGYKNDKGDE